MSDTTLSTQTYRLALGQCLNIHLMAGAVVHVAAGRIALAGSPRWLADSACRAGATLTPGAVFVVNDGGWTTLAAEGHAEVRIVQPATPPGWRRLIKSRFGRSGLLLGNSRPPDPKAAEMPVPHATSK
ncbi:hypothetical protein [Cupriavidus campinensis]